METTLFPLQSLPPCATKCGKIYDVNGGCVPPTKPTAAAEVYAACFCADKTLASFSQGTTGVCDTACTDNPDGLNTIRNWYTSFCANVKQGAGQDGNGDGAAPTKTAGGSTGKSGGGGGGGGNTWLSSHYQWVIFLVVMVVGIAGIWVGLCIWRRRYLRRKDRQYALGKRLAHVTGSGRVAPNASQAASIHVPGAGMFEPAPISSAAVYGGSSEKPPKGKKKWIVKERT